LLPLVTRDRSIGINTAATQACRITGKLITRFVPALEIGASLGRLLTVTVTSSVAVALSLSVTVNL
jgi:hypothetical protein